ncbi:MAG: hypothetical protein IPK94_13325 [Saprospiraceae bacterium]|nr:hypothetical protein [Saprospiraceae bacterium]
MDNTKQVLLIQKIIACVLTAFVTAYPLARLNPNFFPNTVFARILAYLLFAIIISVLIFWKYIERKTKQSSHSILGLVNSILAFALAFHFTKWGLLKILRLHMTDSLGLMEMPMTMVSGDKQLSHFFGQSYPMVCILGLLEISGAIFILFRKTRLLGTMILFVMAANIIIIDILYYVYDPLLEAITLLIGVLYLAYQDKEKILNFFFSANENLPKFYFNSSKLKNALRLLAILIPIIILTPHYRTQYRQGLTGKYNIEKMTVNGKDKIIDQCSDTTFSKVYFDLGDFFIFTNNNFKKRQIGHFTIDEATRTFETTWQYPTDIKDNFKGKVTELDKNNRMKLTGINGQDTLELELEKIKMKNFNKTY